MTQVEMNNLSLFEVPETSQNMIKKYNRYGQICEYHNDLVQIVVGNYAVIYNIENVKAMFQVKSLQTINQFLETDKFVDTGFKLSSSQNEFNKDGEIESKKEHTYETNARGTIFFSYE